MTWLRVDDTSLTHPKVMHLRSLDLLNEGLAEHVVGFVMLAATWSGQHTTDCLIPCSVGLFASPHHWQRLSDAAIKVGMLSKPRKSKDGQLSWTVRIDDGLFHLLSKDEIDARKNHRKASRQVLTRCEILLRDGDLCRYCGNPVNPHDKRGNMKRHFEHVDPAVPDELVVSCEVCNQRKGQRTPTEAGLVLLDPPQVPAGQLPYLHPDSLLYISKHAPHLLRPDSQPVPAPRPDSQSVPAPAPAPLTAQQPPAHPTVTAPSARAPTVPPPPGPDPTRTRPETQTAGYARPGSAGTGRDGPGRVGTGGPGSTPPPAGTRRTRARRGRTSPSSTPPEQKA